MIGGDGVDRGNWEGGMGTIGGAVVEIGLSLGGGRGYRGGQHNTPKFLIYFFCDISLITKKSSSLVSHYI